MSVPKSKILVIEDEEHIALGLKLHLEKEGHSVELAKDGEVGLKQWQQSRPDLIVLDIMMPKIDGLEVLKEIRRNDPRLPILILSAKDSTYDKVKALKSGVDDYLAKPFDAQELLLRLERLLLKKQWAQADQGPESQNESLNLYHINDRVVDLKNSQVSSPEGEVTQLTDQELKLLKVFLENPHVALPRKDLLKKAWGYQEEIETRTLDNFIVRFRKYFETDPKRPKIFKSIRSVGYMFVPESKE